MKHTIDSIIRNKLNMHDLTDISLAKNYETNIHNKQIVNEIVNEYIKPIQYI